MEMEVPIQSAEMRLSLAEVVVETMPTQVQDLWEELEAAAPVLLAPTE